MTSMKRFERHIGGTLAAVLAVVAGVESAAIGQPTPTPDHIGEVSLFGEEEVKIQVATKTETPLSKAPGAVTVITAQQIRQSNARSIPELLRMVAGVNVRWNPMVQTIDVRSFGQNPFTSRVLLLIDGVPYNDWNKGGFSQHPSFDFFVLQNVKRIEVVRGPGSSLYGENAYWGVVNIVTLSGEDLRGGRFELFAGDRDTASAGAMWGQKIGEGSLLVSGKFVRSQLPMVFWFDEQDSQVEGTDAFVKATWKGLQFSYYRHDDEFDGYRQRIGGGPTAGVFASADPIEQTVDITALKVDHQWDGGRFSFGGDVSYARRDGTRCAGCHALAENRAFAEPADHGHQLIGDFRFGFRPVASHDILIGVEARQVDAGDHVDEFVARHAVPGGAVFDYEKLAAYLQDQMSFADDRVRVTAGVRYDGDNDLFDDAVSPRLALVATPNDRLVLRAGWSQAFRFPTFTELYQNSWFIGSDTGTRGIPFSVFAPNPSLEPEEITSYEAGFEYRLNPSLSARVDLFHSTVDDFMVLAATRPNPTQPTQLQVVNHPDEAEIFGGELELRWNVGRTFTGFLSYAHEDPDQKGSLRDPSGKLLELVYAPENKVNLAAYLGPFAGFRAALEAQWRDEFTGPSLWNRQITGNPNAGEAVMDAYTLVNLRLSYDLPFQFGGARQAPRVSVFVKDVFDEAPVETLIPFNLHLPGREVFASLDFDF
jgi:outer membrane receptor for ferrienterochelin and colicins